MSPVRKRFSYPFEDCVHRGEFKAEFHYDFYFVLWIERDEGVARRKALGTVIVARFLESCLVLPTFCSYIEKNSRQNRFQLFGNPYNVLREDGKPGSLGPCVKPDGVGDSEEHRASPHSPKTPVHARHSNFRYSGVNYIAE
ncbi:hypothetical protein BU25DRAFT_471994 [Macroventuria anomochaeta]|uniref:Uncharacterized protein n=1 Tax=Macroventuria anomochaeta TaxID=301207 RepID=A0ACB6RYX2_9PLEO|nr:uncharacterized protein BU25DRAFT_471994 [Macroventuria anomochaeta]KAF2626348.1 hypothetical protein BU25DRAFT_471994 [Macroventuria anomochaeta]